MRTEEFDITNNRGQTIKGKICIPDKDADRYPAVIFAHGFASNYRELFHHGDGFADAGIVCVFFDFCGGGPETISDGKMTDMTLLTEIDDLKCVIDHISALDYVDPDRLCLQGESMGGFVSAYVASEMPDRIKALILWYPAFVIPDDSRRRLEEGKNTVLGHELNEDYNSTAANIDIYGIIGKYTRPVLIIHGDMDTLVPIEYSNRACEVYQDVRLEVIKGAGHGFDGDDSRHARELSVGMILNC